MTKQVIVYAGLWQSFIYYRFYSFVEYFSNNMYLSFSPFMVHFEGQKLLLGVDLYNQFGKRMYYLKINACLHYDLAIPLLVT